MKMMIKEQDTIWSTIGGRYRTGKQLIANFGEEAVYWAYTIMGAEEAARNLCTYPHILRYLAKKYDWANCPFANDLLLRCTLDNFNKKWSQLTPSTMPSKDVMLTMMDTLSALKKQKLYNERLADEQHNTLNTINHIAALAHGTSVDRHGDIGLWLEFY
jgi:hypothetical protein